MSDAQAGVSANSLLSGIVRDVVAKIHRTVRWGSSAHANGRQRNQQAINERRVASTNGHQVAPDCPVCQGDPSCNGCLHQIRKEIVHYSCPVVHWTVRCAHGQKATIAYQNGAPTTPSYLGAINETPRRMEQYIKPPLNIPRFLDSANMHLIHCLRDLSTCLSC
jgi:hypothetical protein